MINSDAMPTHHLPFLPQIKSIFLMTSIVNSDPASCEPLWRMGIIEQLVGLAFHHVDAIEGGDGNGNSSTSDVNFLTEHVFSALCFFAAFNGDCLEECRRPDLPLRSTLRKRLARIQDDEQFEEERGYAKKLLNLVDGPAAESTNESLQNCDTER